jgi:CHRD domain
MLRRTLLASAVIVLGVYGARAQEPMQLHAMLDGSHEVPPSDSKAKGNFDGTYDKSTKELKYTITYEGFASPVVAAHFHGPAAEGSNGPVAVPIKAPLTSPIKGEVTLTEAQAGQLLGQQWYVNIHTKNHPQGAIRGQVLHGGP